MPVTDPSIDFKVGHLDGRLTTMETRMDRHETDMRTRLTAMDGKLDSLLSYRSERTGVLKQGHWFLGTLLAIMGLVIGGASQVRDLFHH